MQLDLPLTVAGEPIANLDQLLELMHSHLARFDAARDNRAAFLRVYATMTASVKAQLHRSFFIDSGWIERVGIRFAWYYFDALQRYEQRHNPPPAWQYAFDIALHKQGFVLQDVLMGMNAHINNDLPLVVAEFLRAGGEAMDPQRATRRRFDHDQINRVLFQIIPDVERVTAHHYARLIQPLGLAMGTLDQSLSLFGLKTWRDNVWKNALFLLSATDDREWHTINRGIQEDALHVARSIERFPVLRHLRRLAPWSRRLRMF